jgi:hypothetical protein
MKIRILLASAAFAVAGLGVQPQAHAMGCISGGVAGAVAGHMVNHGVLGAIGGCVAGHSYSKRQKRDAEKVRTGAPSQTDSLFRQGDGAPPDRGSDRYQ